MNNAKDISYLGKDYNQFKGNLIEFAKQYFPDTYTDFNEASPGTLFLEMAAYVGDVLSFYSDNNLKESLLEQATERGNQTSKWICSIPNYRFYRLWIFFFI